jgi:hypothetical protein
VGLLLGRRDQVRLREPEHGPFQQARNARAGNARPWYRRARHRRRPAGFFTRPFAVLFIAEKIVAILSTKISLYLGISPLPPPFRAPADGIWAVMHEWRSNIAQLACSLFLLLEGPGRWSLDAALLSST